MSIHNHLFQQPFFAFEFKEKYGQEDGWDVFDQVKEFKRMVSFFLRYC